MMQQPTGNTELVVITGLSGSGKTLAMRAMEDLAFYCVDNLPVELIPTFYDLCRRSGRDLSRVAMVVDIRGGSSIAELPQRLEEVRGHGQRASLVYLEASDDALLRRFTESRRPHPLSPDEPLPESIAKEREILDQLKPHADVVVDTSSMTPHELRDFLLQRFRGGSGRHQPRITVTTFGFKHGMPTSADLVFDVRFLPNPHFVEGMREKTGADEEVQQFLEESELYTEFRERLADLMHFLIPAYTKEGKSYLTIAIGCTGGRHRSVAVALHLAESLESAGHDVELRHRDVGRT